MLKIMIAIYSFFFLTTFAFAEKKLNFAIFAARDKSDPFFASTEAFAKAAGKNLGFNIEVFFANGDHYLMPELVKGAIESKKFDAFIIMNFKNSISKTVKICEDNNVKYFIYNATFIDPHENGLPREKLKNWLGEMIPDNEQAGYDLAKRIVAVTKYSDDRKKHFIAFSGNIADQAAIKRANGIERFVKENKDVELDQLVFIPNWSREIAVERFLSVYKRYPTTKSYWAASDNIAVGIYEEAKKNGLNIITGSFDWSTIGLEAIKEKKIVASVGGHFMEGAWVSIMLFDYFHGLDFYKTEGSHFRSKMGIIDLQNLKKYEPILGKKEYWEKIDFRNYSKFYNKNLVKYKFNYDSILNFKR